jgi:hypothetical protein
VRPVEPTTKRRILGLTLREHVGGRWAISLAGYTILAPFTLITLASDITSFPVESQWALWVIAAIVSYLGFGCVYLVANFTLFRNRQIRPVPIAWVALLGAVASVVRAEANSLLTYEFGLIPNYATDLPLRLATNILVGAILWTLIPLTLSLVSSFRGQRHDLMVEAADMRGLQMRTSGESKILENAIRTSIAAEFTEVISTRDALAARSMSHRMWESASEEAVPRLRLRQLIVRTLNRNPYAVLPVLIIWGLSTWGSSAQALGPGAATLRMSVCCVTLFVSFRYGRRWTYHHPDHSLAIFVVVMAVVLSVVGPITSIIFDSDPVSASAVTIANCIWLLVIVLTVSFVNNSLTYSEEIIGDLKKDLVDSEVDLLAAQTEERRVRMELATLLHGSVQSRLLSAAALMSQDPSTIANPEVEDALVNIPALLFESPAKNLGLRAGLELAAEPWQILMDIEITIETDVSDTAGSNEFVHIAQEALANSFRHGRASSVHIDIFPNAHQTTMMVKDNGEFAQGCLQPGLGSALLDTLAPGRWKLTANTEGGALLTVTTDMRH